MKHIPVLAKETIKILDPKPNENIIDATLGQGGHASLILEKTAPKGQLLGVEQDIEAIKVAEKNLKIYGNRVSIVNNNFTEIGLIKRSWDVESIDGILLDLGPNTEQLKSEERGLSFKGNAKLDMRLDKTRQKLTAADIVNKYSEKEIMEILFAGEEKFSKAIAKRIVINRKNKDINTTSELVEIIKQAIPPKVRFGSKKHFATGTFRALRMEVNNELENLRQVLPQLTSILSPGGRIAVISFHSLEDRIVKNFFRDKEDLEILVKKPIIATDQEMTLNPNARSAKLRAAKKI
jgi:16S rRNA (cytosine1402-N4)-methyltransferase